MSRHTTMQVGGPAAMLAQPRDIRELVSLVYLAGKNNFRCMVMGNGSNLIFPDEGLSLIHISYISFLVDYKRREGRAHLPPGRSCP